MTLGVVDVDERLPGEHRASGKGNDALDPWLVLGLSHPSGSITKPRAWAYSTKAWLNRGSNESASSTIVAMLSGITTLNTPPKKTHAASKPAITASVVWRKVNHTKQCRE